MKILAFDTSKPKLYLSILNHKNGQNEFHSSSIEDTSSQRQGANVLLLPELNRLLEISNTKKQELDLLVVGIGPGGFTGIRVGVVLARTLAQSMNLPLIGISLFECYKRHLNLPAQVLLSAGKERFYLSTIHTDNTDINQSSQVCTMEEFKDMLRSNESLAENIYWDQTESTKLEGKTIKSLPNLNNLAEEACLASLERLKNDALFSSYSYKHVVPLYIRQPSITIKKAPESA